MDSLWFFLMGKRGQGVGASGKLQAASQSHFTPSAAKEDLADRGEVHTEGNFPFSPQLPLFPYHPAPRKQLSSPRGHWPFHIHTVKTHTEPCFWKILPIVAKGTHIPHVEPTLTAARLLQMSSVLPRIQVPGSQNPHQIL